MPRRFTDHTTGFSWQVLSEWRQEAGPGVQACTSYELASGPKRYARKWDRQPLIEWGWVLHPTAHLVWQDPDAD